ncbi:MAG: tRNA (adenosine(37)-N6)-threonylcarbamoyltransferase complex dimerization subunit type 1 TsaB [Planctomycetota bacterium]|jgi:tRNA threonylcarbamoyladenosine biosynthesis protein TsaB
MSVILAIEVSQRLGGVALRDTSGAVHVEAVGDHQRHDDVLMPTVERLFTAAGLAPERLDAVGVSIGPGGFTGLRIAVSSAKMMALALGADVVAVPSAHVAAESLDTGAVAGDTVLVALASKRGSFWATVFARDADRFQPRDDGRLVDAETASLEGVSAVLGDRFLPEVFRARCDDRNVPVLEPVFDPRACLAVTERLRAGGGVTDPRALAPLYPRPPEAVTLWEARRRPGSA